MSQPVTLIELQSVHDNLRTIQRDLSNYPPDMAALAKELTTLDKRLEETTKAINDATSRQAYLQNEMAAARKAEDQARVALKAATQKVQFTAAIREVDDKERVKAGVAKPLKEVEGRLEALGKEKTAMEARRAVAQVEFDGLHQIFLSEHENQVVARDRLMVRRRELEATLSPEFLVIFDRLILNRQGKALVAVEDGSCSGCNTRLRKPLLSQLRDEGTLACEACQRYLYFPAK
jgi:predicted  nucleic acid-binding Zn-ribbon protein